MPSRRLFHFVIKRFVTFAVVGWTALAAVPANATFVSAGNTVVYDFDFTGQTPPPPYTNQMALEVHFSTFSTVDIRFFDGLNGTGLKVAEIGFGPSFGFSYGGLTEPGLLDGVFSVKVLAVTDVDITTVKGFAANVGDTVFHIGVDGVLVPEPPTVGLLAAGLLTLAALARRSDALRTPNR
jgi:hypothetical protein